MKRLMVVADENGRWFVRRVASSALDLGRNEMRYSCDKHVAGPFDGLDEAVEAAKKAL